MVNRENEEVAPASFSSLNIQFPDERQKISPFFRTHGVMEFMFIEEMVRDDSDDEDEFAKENNY